MFIQTNQNWSGRISRLAALVAGSLLVGQAAFAAGGDVVRTESGLVHGGTTDGLRMFKGIPYATAQRWQEPRPVTPWSGVRDATQPGARCAQTEDRTSGTPASTSEDCLYLNVTAAAGHNLPVLVYVHGGGLKNGAGSDLEPRRLAAREHAIVVTLNYRLGVFGFFGAPGLPGSGTFGLWDQQAAMTWVRHNIAAFGGGAHNVTLFGESGGGDSVCAQLVSPTARGLFDRVLIQSGTCSDANPVDALFPGAGAVVASWQPVSTVEESGVRVATALGCPAADPGCLRGIPVDRLLGDPAVAAVYWSPAYNTALLPRRPAAAIEAGGFARVPVMIGTTRDEATLLVTLTGQAKDNTAYRALLARAFGDRADEVAAAYSAYALPARAWAAIVGDRGYVCPNQGSASVLARYTRTYAYEFADQDAPLIFHVDPSFPLGAYHASDVPYIWDSTAPLSPAQQGLSNQLLDYVGRFAATGDPNGWGTPYWANVRPNGSAPVVQRLAPGEVGPARTADEHHCVVNE